MAKSPKRAKPVPLTKAQLQTDAGQELLDLAEAVTDDGLVSAAEVTRLHRWLHRHADEDLPAVGFLNEEVDQLREDEKKGDSWPRRRLHRALERVLPQALREQAKGKRKEAEALEFAWGSLPEAEPPAPAVVLPQPVMQAGVATLLCPMPDVPLKRLRAAVAARVARREVTDKDMLRDLTDPPKKEPKKAVKKVEPASEASEGVVRVENLPTPDPIARVKVSAEVVARSRYRGELLWFDGKPWAVFMDPDDSDCRYAQVVA
jgi:hypothetical protein